MNSNNSAHILLLDPKKNESGSLRQELSKSTPGFRCNIDVVATTTSALQRLRKKQFDDIIVNLPSCNAQGIKTVEKIHRNNPDVPILILTDSVDAKQNIEAQRHGASACFTRESNVWYDIVTRIRHLFQERELLRNLVKDYCYRKSLMTTAPCPIVCISPEGKIVEVNTEAERLWNCKGNQLLGRTFLDMFIADENRDALSQGLTEALSGKQSKNHKVMLEPQDRDLTSLLWDLGCAADSQGRVVSIVAMGHDVIDTEAETCELAATRYARYNPNFEDTTYMVLAGLSAIIQRLDTIAQADPARVRQLADQAALSGDEDKMPPERISAVERLILNLLTKNREPLKE